LPSFGGDLLSERTAFVQAVTEVELAEAEAGEFMAFMHRATMMHHEFISDAS
jgi:hypothetical protein